MDLPPPRSSASDQRIIQQNASNIGQTAVPTVKVMRLQSPNLALLRGAMNENVLGSSLRLPESFGVIHIGETFTAYISALNTSHDLYVRGLNVSAQLQTPSKRVNLPSNLESANCDLHPLKGRDFLISQPICEVGQHILRLTLTYLTFNQPSSFYADSGGKHQNLYGQQQKTIRKFYRFTVSQPMTIKVLAKRGSGDASVLVSISATNSTQDGLTIHECDFQPPYGLLAEKIEASSDKVDSHINAVKLYERCGILDPGSTRRYLFLVKACSQDALLRGIAVGDELGHAVFSYQKAMGESGRIVSATVYCPSSEVFDEKDSFVVHGSGLSVDVAASAANRSNMKSSKDSPESLDSLLPVTVEPIEPPTYLTLFEAKDVQLLVVNHSDKTLNLQIQMRLSDMKGVKVCGKSFQNLGEVKASGGSCIAPIKILPVEAGLFRLQGCVIVDLISGREIVQPALFNAFVHGSEIEAGQ